MTYQDTLNKFQKCFKESDAFFKISVAMEVWDNVYIEFEKKLGFDRICEFVAEAYLENNDASVSDIAYQFNDDLLRLRDEEGKEIDWDLIEEEIDPADLAIRATDLCR